MIKGIIKTAMLHRYAIKFVLRLTIFVLVFGLYLTKKELLMELIRHKFAFGVEEYGITPLHILWTFFMVMMLLHLFPHRSLSMALRKNKEENYVEVPGYSEYELLKFVQNQNIKAWKVMLVWLSGNAVVGALYLFEILDSADLLMLTVFYFLCDYICILFFCPFQTFLMKNKCCVNCRIYDWGHFMMFTPMLFIKNFFSWSLFFTSLVVLIHWEIVYAKYPQRFWSGSNQTLKCKNCRDKTCQMKKRLKCGKDFTFQK
ncbi:MAG: hypothetical protein J6J42_06645 [Lachnospiraceae bacterium]|nr:hypothetical protein [Lachnospiraceae bacterium]MBP3609998.1 hypothetical protein [Lachnospiraceae bacterium]